MAGKKLLTEKFGCKALLKSEFWPNLAVYIRFYNSRMWIHVSLSKSKSYEWY